MSAREMAERQIAAICHHVLRERQAKLAKLEQELRHGVDRGVAHIALPGRTIEEAEMERHRRLEEMGLRAALQDFWARRGSITIYRGKAPFETPTIQKGEERVKVNYRVAMAHWRLSEDEPARAG